MEEYGWWGIFGYVGSLVKYEENMEEVESAEGGVGKCVGVWGEVSGVWCRQGVREVWKSAWGECGGCGKCVGWGVEWETHTLFYISPTLT